MLWIGFIQFRLLKESIKVVTEKPKGKNSVSSFEALMISTASLVGTGNIIGVSSAICLGGNRRCILDVVHSHNRRLICLCRIDPVFWKTERSW